MPPNPEKRFESRWRLLCSARDVFARDGYYRASLNEIANDAGVTTGSIYSHFRDKEDLFVSVVREVAEDATHELRQLPDAFNELEPAVAELADRYAHVVDGWPDWPLLAQASLTFRAHRTDSRDAQDLAAAHEAVQRELAGLLARIAANLGRQLRRTPEIAARTIGASLYGLAFERALNPTVIDDTTLRSFVATTLRWALEREPIGLIDPLAETPEAVVSRDERNPLHPSGGVHLRAPSSVAPESALEPAELPF